MSKYSLLSKRRLLSIAIAGIAGGMFNEQVNAQSERAVEEIAVTGSRIMRDGMSMPTPVTVMTRDEMEVLSPGSLMDSMDQMPQFLNSLTVDNAGGATWTSTGGQSVINMRGLGPERTLVLVDGRRIVPSNHLGLVDINQFPQALISRTEIVTGGASAAYGSDAVAGVSNFILDTDFVGFDAMAQGGINHIGDGENYRASLAGGFELGDRVHVVLGGDWFRAGGIPDYSDRDWFKNWGTLNFGETNGVPNQTPQRIRRENVCARNATFGGLITHGPLAGTHFLSDGTPATYYPGEQLDGAAMAGLNNISAANPNGIIAGNMMSDKEGSCDHIAYRNVVQASQERSSFLGNIKIDLNSDTQLSLQMISGRNEIANQRGGYSWLGTRDRITIYDDNAYLHPVIRERMQESGINSFQMHKILPHDDPLNNAGLGAAVTTGSSVSYTAALSGGIGSNWRYDSYYQYGVGERNVVVQSNRRDRTYRAMEAVFHPETGEIVCRSTLTLTNDGCIPYNVFGQGNQSEQVARYFNDFMWVNSEVKQHVAEFVVNGEIYEGWGAGAVSMAAGIGYRKEDVVQIGGDPIGSPIPIPPDGHLRTPLDEDGNKIYFGLPPGIEGNNIMAFTNAPSIGGGYDVKEAFMETLIPVFRDVRGAEGFDISLAVRFADYEGSGSVWAWKAGSDWQITDDLRFRMTRSRDIRAANLNERFNATTGGGTVTDPDFGDEQYTVSVHVGGNPEVRPEFSDALTFGFVYQPAWLEGFSASIDYFDIKITDAINQIGIASIMFECYRSGAFCEQIIRGNDGRVQVVRNVFINLDQFRTRGGDIEFGYRKPIELFGGGETLSLRLIGSHLFESSITPYEGDKLERAGLGDFAPWNAVFNATYIRGPLSIAWSERWRSAAVQDVYWESGIDIDNNRISSQSLSNLRISYNFESEAGSYNFYGAINNIFDRNPGDVMGLNNIYFNMGRNYTLGVRYNF